MYTSGIVIEVAQEKWKDFGAAAEALAIGLIAEGIPAKGSITTGFTGAALETVHVGIGRRQ